MGPMEFADEFCLNGRGVGNLIMFSTGFFTALVVVALGTVIIKGRFWVQASASMGVPEPLAEPVPVPAPANHAADVPAPDPPISDLPVPQNVQSLQVTDMATVLCHCAAHHAPVGHAARGTLCAFRGCKFYISKSQLDGSNKDRKVHVRESCPGTGVIEFRSCGTAT